MNGVALPRCDTQDPVTAVNGAQKRMMRDVQLPQGRNRGDRRAALHRLRGYVRRFVRARLTPLDRNTDVSIETWLAQTSYSEVRKNEIRECGKAHDLWDNRKYYRNKSFIKEETYVTPKHARCINSRTDHFKALTGPYFHCIEHEVLQLDEFVKFVPVCDRPAYIMDNVYAAGSTYRATDFTSWESLLTPEVMMACEMELYKYMLQDVPRGHEVFEKIRDALCGENHCSFKWFNVVLAGSRMSGDMCTSLGNGFTNMIVCKFLASERGGKCIGVFEGDDGLMRFVPEDSCPTQDDFRLLGFEVKMEVHQDIETASFCGMVFDTNDRIVVADPRKIMATMGWAGSAYVKAKPSRLLALRKCKALSVISQYGQCPIVGLMARKISSRVGCKNGVLEDFIMRDVGLSLWERQKLIDTVDRKVPPFNPPTNTRILVERLYGISVEQQLEAERLLHDWDGRSPLDFPGINFPEAWRTYSRDYVVQLTPGIVDAFIDVPYYPCAYSLEHGRPPEAIGRSALGRPRRS